jgi:hypothetical protein
LTKKPNPYVGEILDAAFSNAGAVVVVLSGDDEARVREAFATSDDDSAERVLQPQARPNVIFECGTAMGRHPNRTVVVQIGAVRSFTDLDGVHILRLVDDAASRKEFASRLETAGCPVDTSGSDFLTAGDIRGALDLADRRSLMPPDTAPAAPPWLAVVAEVGAASAFWHLGKQGDQPAMQFVANFWVTNLTDQPVRIVRARVDNMKRERLAEAPLLVKDPSNTHGEYSRCELPANCSVEATFCAFADTVHATIGQDFGASVVFVDARERTHQVHVVFKNM